MYKNKILFNKFKMFSKPNRHQSCQYHQSRSTADHNPPTFLELFEYSLHGICATSLYCPFQHLKETVLKKF